MVRLDLQSIAYEAKVLSLAREGYASFYVDDNLGKDIHNGGTWNQAFKTVQHAIDESGSWAKIFIKAGTYPENVVIADESIQLIGEKRDTTKIQPTSGNAITVSGESVYLENLHVQAPMSGSKSIGVTGAKFHAKGVAIGGAFNSYGIVLESGADNSIIDTCFLRDVNPFYALYLFGADDCIIKYCEIDMGSAALRNGLIISGSSARNKIFENTITALYGIIAVTSENNTILHNNLIDCGTMRIADSGTNNKWFENHFSDYTTDTNNNGLTDSVYSENGATDYQPVSRRNGWRQQSLGGLGGGGSVGDATLANQLLMMGTSFATGTDSLKALSDEVDEILDLERNDGDITVTSVETELYKDDAPIKIMEALSIKINAENMGASDIYELREYYRIASAGAYVEVADTVTLTGVQADPLKVLHLEAYRYGLKVTAKKTAGTDRVFPVEIIRGT